MWNFFDIIFFIFGIMLLPMLIFAPWVPTRKRDIERIALLSEAKPTDVIYDLGSGDGKVIFGLSEKTRGRLTGIESFFPLFIYSYIKKKLLFKNHNIHFLFGDFFKFDLKDATIVYVFGLPGKMEKLIAKLKKECKTGTKIMSYAFPMEGFKEIKKDKPSANELSIYIYEIE